MTGLDWFYGPTAEDPEPSKKWHRGCGGEVLGFKEGLICSKCKEGSDYEHDPSPQPEDGGDSK